MELLQQVMQQLVNGISLGSIYALIALGYTMIYGIIKLINFAHGDIYMVGAYIGFFAITQAHLSIVPSLLISLIVTGFLGMVVERLAYKPLRHAPRISVLITAIGVSFFLEYTTMYFVSPTPRTFPAMFGDVAVNIAGIVINGQQMLILGITAVLMVVLTYIVQKTKTGKAMRAASIAAIRPTAPTTIKATIEHAIIMTRQTTCTIRPRMIIPAAKLAIHYMPPGSFSSSAFFCSSRRSLNPR